MKKHYCLALYLLLSSLSAFGQQAIWDKPAVVSPEVSTDHRVTFRIFAPNAKKVELNGDFLPEKVIQTSFGEMSVPAPVAMQQRNDGIWEYTTAILPSELYNYTFSIDDMRTTDPSNVFTVRDVSSISNYFLISGGKGDVYSVNGVPHGSVSRVWYDSPTLGMKRRMTVYTPPGYEQSTQEYPVLYLLHGMGGDEEAWIALGRTAQILDNLIASGEAKPMMVVMTNGNAAQEAAPGEAQGGLRKPETMLPKTMDGTFEGAFPDVVSFIDSNYRTQKNKSGRAIAGLSMGGFHSLHISKTYPDLFDYVGLFSAAILPSRGASSPLYENTQQKLKEQFAKQPKLYWIAIGKTDFLYNANVDFRKILDENKYPYTYVETGGGHTWRNWRDYLSRFSVLLFQ